MVVLTLGFQAELFSWTLQVQGPKSKKVAGFRMIPVKDSLYLLPNQSLVNFDLQGKQTQHHPWDWYIYLHLSYHTMKKQPFM